MSIRVGILGATGAVGQTFVRLLADHPLFTVTALAASERSAGKPYHEAANWISDTPLDPRLGDLVVQPVDADLPCDLVFSGLDASVAGEVEADFARRGYAVLSNARNHRMAPDVPLLIPEVNPYHLALIERQAWTGADGAPSGGFIVTNPNCSTVGLVLALKPLHDAFGVEAVHVVTMQALSGAGYPGVPSLDILGNVVPFIGGEEDKMAVETRKLLGALGPDGIADADVVVSAQCNRVPVIDGHTEAASVRLARPASPEEVAEALRAWRSPIADLGLPTAPAQPIAVFDDPRFPQPRRHASLGGGMTVSVGRIQACPVLGVKLVVLSHNTVRGAAGGAILNAELLHAQGRLPHRP
jgi:aspartate-semialdehyde dehydrogenase